MFQAAELDSCLNPLKLKSQILDLELQDMVFALLAFSLAFAQ